MSKSNTIIVPRLYAALGSKDDFGNYPIELSRKGDNSDTMTIGYATRRGKTAMHKLCEAYNAAMNGKRQLAALQDRSEV